MSAVLALLFVLCGVGFFAIGWWWFGVPFVAVGVGWGASRVGARS